MNGRLYDPVVGRFFSPDIHVQDPSNTQSYNRYSYCLNNPLKYTDPSGNTWWDKFWNWTGERGIQFGINTGSGGPVPNISAPGPGNSRVGIGFNTKTGQVGFGNNSSGFMNFNFLTKNYDVAAQNFVTKTLPNVRGQHGPEWHGSSNAGLDVTFYVGALLTVGEKTLFSNEFGTWMGKDLQLRSQKWGGNGSTGGKFKFAESFSTKIGYLGKALGVYSMYGSYGKWQNGEISNKIFGGDMVSGMAGILGGIYGASWSFGWELGKKYGPSQWNTPDPDESIILEYMRKNGY